MIIVSYHIIDLLDFGMNVLSSSNPLSYLLWLLPTVTSVLTSLLVQKLRSVWPSYFGASGSAVILLADPLHDIITCFAYMYRNYI